MGKIFYNFLTSLLAILLEETVIGDYLTPCTPESPSTPTDDEDIESYAYFLVKGILGLKPMHIRQAIELGLFKCFYIGDMLYIRATPLVQQLLRIAQEHPITGTAAERIGAVNVAVLSALQSHLVALVKKISGQFRFTFEAEFFVQDCFSDNVYILDWLVLHPVKEESLLTGWLVLLGILMGIVGIITLSDPTYNGYAHMGMMLPLVPIKEHRSDGGAADASGARWEEFLRDPSTVDYLRREAHRFIERCAHMNLSSLELNGKWIYLGKEKKHGYLGREQTSSSGMPHIHLVYHSFKHGGYKEVFNSRAVLQELWESYKAGRPVKTHNTRGYRKWVKNSIKECQTQEARKARAVKADCALWPTLSAEGTSEYFQRKKLTQVPVLPDSIRYGADEQGPFVAARIMDLEGETCGLQKIRNDGCKKFTYGLKKNGKFIFLGSKEVFMTEKPKVIYLYEGLATGLTGYWAVQGNGLWHICVLDAGNLAHVVEELRKKFPRAEIYVDMVLVPDNDQWKCQLDTRLGNTGFLAASALAMKYRYGVVYPCFNDHIKVVMQGKGRQVVYQILDAKSGKLIRETSDIGDLPTDINDLMQITGIEEVTRQMANIQRPLAEFSFAGEEKQESDRLHSLFAHYASMWLKERELPVTVHGDGTKVVGISEDQEINLLEISRDYETVFVRSPIGTRKTELMRQLHLANPEPSFLYITHLVSLVEDAARRLELESYTNLHKLQDLPEALAICLNSLPKLIKNGNIAPVDILVIDEVEQVLRRLTTAIKDKRLVLQILRYLVGSAKTVIVLDAYLDATTVKIIESLRPGRKALAIVNQYKVGQGKKVLVYNSIGELQNRTVAQLRNGGKVFSQHNSKREARAMFKLLEQVTCDGRPARGLFISGSNLNDPKVRKFLAHPNEMGQAYDFIVCTPSLTSGISITIDHFTFVVGIFTHTTTTPIDALQALGRIRAAKQYHVFVASQKNCLPTQEQAIAAKWRKTHHADRELMGISATGDVQLDDKFYEELYLRVTQLEHYSKNDFLMNFLRLIYLDGFEITYVPKDEEQLKMGQVLHAYGKELEDSEFIQSRAHSRRIDQQEAHQIEHKQRRTFEETIALERYHIEQFHKLEQCPPEELAQIIKEDRRGKQREEVRRMEITLADFEQLQQMYREQQEAGIDLRPDLRKFAVEQKLYRKVLETVGINAKLEGDGRTYNAQTLQEFIHWVEQERAVLQGIVIIPHNLSDNAVKFVGKLLRRVGLKHKRTLRAQKGEYTVDKNSLEKIAAIIHRRGKVAGNRWQDGTGNRCCNNIINNSICSQG